MAATSIIAVSPPTFVTEGWTTSTARASMRWWKSCGPPAFSPAEMPQLTASRTAAVAEKSSGGQVGSSTQRMFIPSTARQKATASRTVFQAQLMSSMSGISAGAASRAARMQVRSTSWSLICR